MSLKIVGIAGNLNRPSKTRALVETIVGRAAGLCDGRGVVFDLRDLAPSLGIAVHLRDLAPTARLAVDAILRADALVVASPVYKGSYTGLFKHLFDLIEPAALAGKPVLIAASGGGDRHALVIEHQLRPLFGFFETATIATGVYAAERDFVEGSPASPALLERIDRAVDQLAQHLELRGNVRARPPKRDAVGASVHAA